MARILTGSASYQRERRTSIKWALWGPDVLPLWVAEMDASPCPAVVDAVTAAVARGDTGYAVEGRYARAMTSFSRDTWGWDFEPAATLGVADVMIGVEIVLRHVTTVGGAVIVSPPCYDSFFGFVATTRRARIDAPLTAEGRLDFTVLEEAFRAAARPGERSAYLLCSPHNPTGTVHTRAELERLDQLSEQYGVTVVSDEIHAPLVYADSPAFTPWLAVARHGFSVWSASKAWNLAGFKAGLIIAGDGSVDDLRRIHDVHTHGVGHVGAMAHIAAFTDGRDWLGQVIGELAENRQLVEDLLAQAVPSVRVRRPEATYLAWLDARALALGDDPATVWRERAGVALSSGPNYGADAGRGFARLNFATSPEILTEAIQRLASGSTLTP